MPNTFEYADWLSMTCLDLLENKRSVSQFMNTEYSKDFKLKFPVGDTIRVPYPQQFTVRNGLAYAPQSINRRHATVSFQDPFGIDFDWDSAEEALKAPRGRAKVEKEILAPAMSQLAQEIDSRAAQFAYINAASVVGALGTNPTSFDTSSAAARQTMMELACPDDQKAFIVPPAVMRTLKNSAISYFNPVADISKQFRTGIVGSGDGFDWYESVSLYQHTAGNWQGGAGAGVVTVTTAPANGDTTLAVTCTTGDTFLLGDKFAIAVVNPVNPRTRRKVGASTRQYTITQATTGASSSATLSVSPPFFGPGSQYQNIDALPLAGAALTMFPGTTSPMGKTGTISLALHPDAFALVAVEFENPKPGSVEISKQLKDEETGIAISFVRAFDPIGRRWVNRFDTCLGFGALWSDNCAVGICGA